MENVLVTGGTSQMINFSHRLMHELGGINDSSSMNYRFYQTKD